MGTKRNLLLAFFGVLVFFSCSKSEDFAPNNEVVETTVVEEAAGKIVFGMNGNAPADAIPLPFPCINAQYLIELETDDFDMLQLRHIQNSSIASLFNAQTITWTINNQASTQTAPIIPLEGNGPFTFDISVSIYGTLAGNIGTTVYSTSVCIKVEEGQIGICSSETYMGMAGCSGGVYTSGGNNGTFTSTAMSAATFIGATPADLDLNKTVNDPDASAQKPGGGGAGSIIYVMP